MQLKPGDYQIEFKFEPVSYKIGNIISVISSVLLILCILAFAFWRYKSGKNPQQ